VPGRRRPEGIERRPGADGAITVGWRSGAITAERSSNERSASYLAGLFESLQDRRCWSRAGRISGDGKLSCKSLQQLVGWCRNAVYPAEEHDLAVEVVRLDVAGSAPQALP
jgi:hypothetical protein